LSLTIVNIVEFGQNQAIKSSCFPTEYEVRAAARQGEAAVVALCMSLISSCAGVIQQQQETIRGLEERVQAQEDQLAKNNLNSFALTNSKAYLPKNWSRICHGILSNKFMRLSIIFWIRL
jgi:translation initiation factor 2B subunit (eIF-2B alpha/beta/delta family)